MAKQEGGGGGVKTAEQQNAIRRATKARQQAVAKAKALNRAEHEQFDLQAAATEARKRNYFREQREANLQRAIEDSFRDLMAQGAIHIPFNPKLEKRGDWINHCFGIVRRLRDEDNPKLTYNREWKEEGTFRAGVVRN